MESPLRRLARRLATLALADIPALAALIALASGCVWQRTGEPFLATRTSAELATSDWDVIAYPAACCTVTVGPVMDLVGLPVDLGIQAFSPARIRVVDEAGKPVEDADATVEMYVGPPNGTVLRRTTGRDGTFRLRRRISDENDFGGNVRSIRVGKNGYCPVLAEDFSAFSRTNVVTITMPHFVPGAGHVVECAKDDPEGRFPPWTGPDAKREGNVYVDCEKGKVVLWKVPGPTDPDNGDLRLWHREWTDGRDRTPCIVVSTARWRDDRGVALAWPGPEGPDVVPDGTIFSATAQLSLGNPGDDNPHEAIFFRVRQASPDDPPHYGRIDFWWENGRPVGIRRVLYSDAPGERDLRFTAPPPIPVAP